MVYGIILAGGRGERFWPLSRIEKPKQFLRLTSDKTMLEETVTRIRPLIPLDRVRIVAGETMTEQILAAADYIEPDHILTEPRPRNTCLAVGLAAAHLVKVDPAAVMVVLTADHLIRPADKLLSIVEEGCAVASAEEKLITIGIVPTRPETGYGYIKLGDAHTSGDGSRVFNVAAFTEKPKAVVAQEYYYSRKFLWNSGMFVWSAQTLLKTLNRCQPEMGSLLDVYMDKIGTPQEAQARAELYDKAVSISIDYAVLEKATNVLTIKADIVWDDVGSWNSLERYKELDSENNVLIGETATLDTFETTVFNDSDGLVAVLGVSDLVVVRSGDITLVGHKAKMGQIKDLLAKIEADEKTRKYL
ncbi:MAG: NTP transferase domain-containing protein [candidate division Zixibacteria bacterium]|nr:NTP transferase domain-containing protein [candidate division Zixibacteria bacterium]